MTERAPLPGSGEATTRLEQLHRSEFASPQEVIARFLFIGGAAISVYLYTGWIAALAWGGVYFLAQALQTWFLRSRTGPERAWEVATGYAGYCATELIFCAMPVYLLAHDDTAMLFGATMGLMALVIFNLWRDSPPRLLIYFDALVAVGIAGVAAAVYVPLGANLLAQVVMALCACAAVSYYVMALFTMRRARERLKEASSRGIAAQKMEAMGRLTGGIAHDFNNILTVLQGNLELYDEVEDRAERDALVAEAHGASKRAARLVAQLLAYARQAPLDPSAVEVGPLIDTLGSMTQRIIPATIAVRFAAPAAPMTVRADPDQLLTALLNLVINARDVQKAGGLIEISARQLTALSEINAGLSEPLPPGGYCRIDVRDTGPGIPADQLDRVLEPFFTTKAVGEGSGLGLPMAKGFAEQSGGALRLDTGPSGTTVSILLPLSPAAP